MGKKQKKQLCLSVKLLKHLLHLGSVLLLNHIVHLNVCVRVCVSTTGGFCCLSEDWRAAKAGSAHSSHNQAQVMFFCSFSFANK